MSYKIDASDYAMMFGPTKDDKVRLADTNLFIQIEKDFTTYGDEVKFGGGKTFVMAWGNLLQQKVLMETLI